MVRLIRRNAHHLPHVPSTLRKMLMLRSHWVESGGVGAQDFDAGSEEWGMVGWDGAMITLIRPCARCSCCAQDDSIIFQLSWFTAGWGGCFLQQFARMLLELFVLTKLQRFVRILFELSMQPKVLEQCILNRFPLYTMLEDDDDHTNDVFVVDDDDDDGDADDDEDDDDDDDDDDNDPVELFQKRAQMEGIDRIITI